MLKRRFQPALIDYDYVEDPDDPGFPLGTPYSMMGQCPVHGLERITTEAVTPGSDPTVYFKFQCGEVDVDRFCL